MGKYERCHVYIYFNFVLSVGGIKRFALSQAYNPFSVRAFKNFKRHLCFETFEHSGIFRRCLKLQCDSRNFYFPTLLSN